MNQDDLYEFSSEIASLRWLTKSLKSLKSHEIRLISMKSNDFEISYKIFWSVGPLVLVYASTIWNPHLKEDIRNLEKVQRRATKLIPSLSRIPYSDRLEMLNLPSLLYRRTRMDLIMTYKILHGLIDVDKDYFFTINTNPTRSNGLKTLQEKI